MKTWSIPLSCLSLLSISALAQQAPPVSANARQACHADYQKFCKGMRPAGAKECLMSHKDEISQACRDVLSKAQEHAPAENAGQSPPGKSQ
jgi:hypothetical protein